MPRKSAYNVFLSNEERRVLEKTSKAYTPPHGCYSGKNRPLCNPRSLLMILNHLTKLESVYSTSKTIMSLSPDPLSGNLKGRNARILEKLTNQPMIQKIAA